MNTKLKKQTPEKMRRALEETLLEIQQKLNDLNFRYSATYDNIKKYLEFNEPILLESINILEKECDINILDQAENGMMSFAEYNNWLKSLKDWKKLLLEGFSRFENYQLIVHVA
ncbi:hypothetical protein ACFL5P_01780 [candidate division KSB1 bacterium]